MEDLLASGPPRCGGDGGDADRGGGAPAAAAVLSLAARRALAAAADDVQRSRHKANPFDAKYTAIFRFGVDQALAGAGAGGATGAAAGSTHVGGNAADGIEAAAAQLHLQTEASVYANHGHSPETSR